MSKLLNIASFATGYVLGARAGRERYDQIRTSATEAWQKVNGTYVPPAADSTADATTPAPLEDDEIVYSTGPDIDAPVEELMGDNDDDRL
jgi:hypothetical protein